MQRKLLFLVFLLLFGVSYGQQIMVKSTMMLPVGDVGYTSPQFSPDGEKILFTQFGFKGLWLYDLSDNSIEQVNDYPGAGYAPVFTADGQRVIFRVDEYIKMRKYSALAIQTIGEKQIEYLSEKIRFLTPVLTVNGNRLAAVADKALRTFSIDQSESAQSTGLSEPVVYIEDQKIALIHDNQKKLLAPLGDGNYIWSSLSPDKTRLLFTFAGRGTFVADLAGNVLAELGIARAPKWSPDGKWVVCMIDADDGHVVTASDIWVVSADGKTRIQLTRTEDLKEMNPAWSPSMDKIAFDTVDGRIGYLTIEISG